MRNPATRLRSSNNELRESFGRVFWLSAAVIFTDETMYVAFVALLPDFANRFELSGFQAGFLLSAYPLLLLVSCVPAGLLAERYGGRRVLAAGTLLLIVASLGYAYSTSGIGLCASRAVQGFASGLTSTAGMALIAAGGTVSRRGTVLGLAALVHGTSTLAGPAFAGIAVPVLGLSVAFMVPACFGALVLAGLALPGWPTHAASRHLRFRDALIRPLRSPVIRGVVACVFCVGFVGGTAMTIVPLRLGDAGYSAGQIGAVLAAGYLVGLACSAPAGFVADRLGVGRVTVAWSLLVPVAVLGLAVSKAPVVAIALLVLLLPLLWIGGTLGYALGATDTTLGSGLATSYGLALAGWSIGAALGPPIAGLLADATWDGAAFVLAAVVAAVLFIPIAAARRRVAQIACSA